MKNYQFWKGIGAGVVITVFAVIIFLIITNIASNDTIYITVEKSINNNMSYAIYYDNYFPDIHYKKAIYFVGYCDYDAIAEEIISKANFVSNPVTVLLPEHLRDKISINTPSLNKSVRIEFY